MIILFIIFRENFDETNSSGFRLSVIKKAYDIALKDPDFKTTDDCGVVLKYLPQIKIFVVNGKKSI